jgi:hypothetical protein
LPYGGWYSVVEDTDELFQGDLLPSCRVPIITSIPLDAGENDEVPLDLLTTNLVVLTQSCDLDHDRVDSILLGRYDTWDDVVRAELANGNQRIQARATRKLIVDGALVNYFLLPPDDDDPAIPWSVVNFRSLYTLPKQYVEEKAASLHRRRRLQPPYREALSQAFARFSMRVALVEPLDEFETYAPRANPGNAVGAAPNPAMLGPGMPGANVAQE